MSHVFRLPLRRILLACACAGAALAAHAQSAMPAWQGTGPTRYVCGGIGSDESGAMRAAMKDHPLALLFARADGAYLANLDVAIKGGGDNASAAMAFTATGPVCLIDIPAGRYTIDATSNGQTKSQTVTVGGGSKTASFRF
ncbi:carboxypeptidase regulatory-like domain-containing protein [Variovorax boronicumulans]|uniref:carboxypeptidase regulatory-like domain-containing protein n=1 Tax=Variovorax boronicumulans TaxID=436515 RepID=UPI0033976DBD